MKSIEVAALLFAGGLVAVACQGPGDDVADEPTANAPASAPASEPAATPTADESLRVTADQLAEVFAGSEVFLLDVRRPDELEELGTVEGYTNIPIEELAGRLDELPRDRPILTA